MTDVSGVTDIPLDRVVETYLTGLPLDRLVPGPIIQGMTRDELEAAMRGCEQAPGYSVWQHCQDVYDTYLAVKVYARSGCLDSAPAGWRLPAWISDPVVNKDKLASSPCVREYLLWHDCAKPFCLEVDSEGRRHFPGHAEKSSETWGRMRRVELSKQWLEELLAAGPKFAECAKRWATYDIGREQQVESLIRMDMDAHGLTAETLDEFSRRPEAVTLLLAAVAEVHANAAMFGGFDSPSFKIKIKHLERRGRQVIDRIRVREAEHAKAEAVVRELGYIPDYLLVHGDAANTGE